MATNIPQPKPEHPFTCRACGEGYNDYDGCPKCYPEGSYDQMKARCAETHAAWQRACDDLKWYERERSERFRKLVDGIRDGAPS